MNMATKFTTILAIAVLLVIAAMVIMAIVNMRQSGSLDDLPAEVIKRAVDNG